MLILISLAQPSPLFVRVRSLSLWRGSNYDIARRNYLVCLCASDRSHGGAALIFAVLAATLSSLCALRSLSFAAVCAICAGRIRLFAVLIVVS